MDLDNYLISPINGEFEDKIRTLIFCGTKEILKPDSILLYNKFKQNGCPVELVEGDGLFHDFEFFVKMDACQKVFNMIANWLANQPLE